ncbi:hypothetical protein OH779_03115 [Actinacidiphila glaucinigra]|uniref:hypothetical protein n=1 Tax=Actinacidiphila glaucinigra TaxID=235986 RepID=UPI003867C300
MKASFIVHAGLAMLLSGACLVTALVTFLPGASSAGHDSVVLGVCFASLFAVFAGAVVRGIALVSHGVRVQGNVMLQWFALRCLPPAVQAAPAGLFVVGVVLLAGTVAGHDSRRAGEAENGRHYASQDDGPRHERVSVSRTEYQELREHDLRYMLAFMGLVADLAAVGVLITGQVHPTTRPQPQPAQGTAPAA